ncbi:MAG: type III PLP-dependent enzyme [Candidatus Micrarchaeota archaeon]
MIIDFRTAKKIAAKHGTPTIVISENRIKYNYNTFKKYMPRVEVHYAVKANGHRGVLNILRNCGSNFDVASFAEIEYLLSIGVDATRMVYSNPVKMEEDIVRAYNVGVEWFVYDSDAELKKLARYAPESEVTLRIAVSNANSMYKLSSKFGADPKHAIRLLLKAKKMGLNPTGLTFNAGSHNLGATDYIEAIKLSKKLFKEAKKEGISLDTLDIGGGFPPLGDENVDSAKILQEVYEALEEHFPKESGIELIAEPGRFLVKDAGTLVTKVIGKAKRGDVMWYYLDDGTSNSLTDIKFSGWKFDYVTSRRGRKKLCVLAGPTCDSFDVISREEWLPEMEVGDLILVPQVGAYTNGLASHYNGFKPAEIVYINGNV